MIARWLTLTALFVSPLAGCGIDARPGSRTLLEAFAPPTPVEAVDMAFDTENPDRRFRGTMLLANAPWGGEDVYLRLYEEYANDEDTNVRAAAMRALGNHGVPEHVPLIAQNVDDESRLVRIEAVEALQRLHNAEAIDALLGRLDPDTEPETEIRAEAAHALGQYADRTVVQALIASLDDRSLAVNSNARDALKTLTGEDFGFNRREWQAWYNETARPFEGRTPYVYPVFRRKRSWLEYLPFVPPPPNEAPGNPVGLPQD